MTHSTGFMDRLATFIDQHRFLVACFVIVVSVAAGFGLTRVTFDNEPLKVLRSDKIDFRRLEGEFARLERLNLVVLEGSDLISPEAIRTVRKIHNAVTEVEGVGVVYSMLNVRSGRRIGRYLPPLVPSADASPDRFERLREQVASHPLLIGHFLSEDLRTALVIAQFAPTVTGFDDEEGTLGELQRALDRCTPGTGIRARITGTPAFEAEMVQSMRRDIFKLSALGVTVTILIAVILFRRVAAAFLAAAGPAVGSLWTVGTLGYLGEPINVLTNVVPVLVFVIGFTDSVHLVLHMRRALAAGASSREAATSAIRHLGLACALTSLSTTVGFAALLVASLKGIQSFGLCCALGSSLSFFAVITVVPLLASTRLSKWILPAQNTSRPSRLPKLADRMLDVILDYPRTVLGCGIALTIVLASFALRLEPDYRLSMEIPHDNEVYRALEHVDEAFGGTMFAHAVVEWPETAGLRSPQLYEVLEEVHGALDESPLLSNPLSLVNLVKSLSKSDESLARRAADLRYVPQDELSRLVNVEGRRAVVSAHMPDAGARLLKREFAIVDRRFEAIARRHPGFRIELLGESVSVFRSIHLMIEDLWKSLLTAAGVMFIMVWVGLRSLRYALISALPNAFPLLCTAAFIYLLGRSLEMSSVIVFSISLGIAIDDTIHFLVRYRRERESGHDPREAVRRTFRVVGLALVTTTAALVGGHAIVMLSAFPAVRVFGMLTAVSISSALIGDLVILPALLICFAKGRGSG